MYGQPTSQPYFVEPGNPNNGHRNGGADNAQMYGTPSVSAIKPDKAPPTGLRDWPFALLFLLNVGAILALIVLYGSSAVTDTNASQGQVIPAEDAKKLLGVAAAFSVFSLIAGLLMVQLVIRFAAVIINFMLWFMVFSMGALAAFFLLNGVIISGIIFGILCLLSLCYARLVQSRIPFAVANLRVAGAAIKKHPSTYLIAIVFTFVQIAWVLAWTVATLGVAGKLQSDYEGLDNGESCQVDSQCSSQRCAPVTKGSFNKECQFSVSPTSGVATFFLLVSVYWGIEVFANVAHTTIAGTVAAFWFNSDSRGATGGALKRSCTTSFGSICLGSLLVAIIQALKQLARQAQEDDGGVLACIGACLLQCLEDILRYINRWAYVYVGIYGYKFTDAAKAVFELFATRGFDAIINDDLTQSVLVFAALAIGLVCAGIGIGISEGGIIVFEKSTLYLGITGFIVGFSVSMTPLRVVDSSIATIFVCFAEDPVALQQSHPELYSQLVIEWHRLYPDIMVQAGYWTQSYQ